MKQVIHTIDEYIDSFPDSVQERLIKIRKMIKEAAPNATESISYGMPAFKLGGKPMAYFAGYEKHIGFYAFPNTHAAFADQLAGYKQGKGSVQFPMIDPLPVDLIKAMIAFRVRELNA